MTGFVGIEEDYPVSIKEVLNITAETGAFETQCRVRELPRYEEPKKGKWFYQDTMYSCDQCHSQFYDISPFCPMCGADMRESS